MRVTISVTTRQNRLQCTGASIDDKACSRSRRLRPLLESEIAVGGPLHDRLGTSQRHIGAEALKYREVAGAVKQEAEFREPKRLVEFRVVAACDVEVEGIA